MYCPSSDEEIDYELEAQSGLRFRDNFALSSVSLGKSTWTSDSSPSSAACVSQLRRPGLILCLPPIPACLLLALGLSLHDCFFLSLLLGRPREGSLY